MGKTSFLLLPLGALTLFANFTAAGYVLSNAFPTVTFSNPVCITSIPGETNRLFVVERKGRIVVITNLAAPTRTIFMDISSSSSVISSADTSVNSEEGLLGLAFHPGYATNRLFYVFYTGTASTAAGSGRHDILSRFQASNTNPNQGDSASEIRYIVQFDQANNHNAGDLHFGPDGYLYVAFGDEGGSYGNWDNTQKITNDFFSAILRIDVDKRPGSFPPHSHPSALPALTNYAVPPDNPYVNATSFNGIPIANPNTVRTEFWAVGMRNPWRFCFDAVSGELLLGHVGQGSSEWINILTNGANCGWNFYEGNVKWTNSLPPGFVWNPPLAQYGHSNGRNCIIGGVVYRGSRLAQLYGSYLYADHGSGEIWALRHLGNTVTQNSIILTDVSAKWTAFGTDPANGDVLIAAQRGGIDSIIERVTATSASPLAFGISDIRLVGTNVRLSATSGVPNGTFYLLAATNVSQAHSNWPSISTNAFDASGNAVFTNSLNPALSQRFYLLKLP